MPFASPSKAKQHRKERHQKEYTPVLPPEEKAARSATRKREKQLRQNLARREKRARARLEGAMASNKRLALELMKDMENNCSQEDLKQEEVMGNVLAKEAEESSKRNAEAEKSSRLRIQAALQQSASRKSAAKERRDEIKAMLGSGNILSFSSDEEEEEEEEDAVVSPVARAPIARVVSEKKPTRRSTRAASESACKKPRVSEEEEELLVELDSIVNKKYKYGNERTKAVRLFFVKILKDNGDLQFHEGELPKLMKDGAKALGAGGDILEHEDQCRAYVNQNLVVYKNGKMQLRQLPK